MARRDVTANTSTQREQVSLRVSRTHSLARRASIPLGLRQHQPAAPASEPFPGEQFRLPPSEFRIAKRAPQPVRRPAPDVHPRHPTALLGKVRNDTGRRARIASAISPPGR